MEKIEVNNRLHSSEQGLQLQLTFPGGGVMDDSFSSNLEESMLSYTYNSTHNNLVLNDEAVSSQVRNVSLPPLINIPHPEKGKEDRSFDIGCGKFTYKELQYGEWFMSCTGSVMFIVGSYFFFDGAECGEVDCELPGALLFLAGSVLFFIASWFLFVRSEAGTWNDLGLSTTATLYMIANFEFIVGSYFFIPAVIEDIGSELPGVTLFLAGSIIFFFAPLYDMYRAWLLRSEGTISRLTLLTEFTVALGYIVGAALFVVGSVLFLPALYSVWAAPIFLIGSCCFLISTLAGSLAAFLRYVQKRFKICRKEDFHAWLPVLTSDDISDDNTSNTKSNNEFASPFQSPLSASGVSNNISTVGIMKNDFSQSSQNEDDIIRVVDVDNGDSIDSIT